MTEAAVKSEKTVAAVFLYKERMLSYNEIGITYCYMRWKDI